MVKHHGFSEQDLVDLIQPETKTTIPATAFDNNLTPLETLTRYLEDKPELEQLNRPQATIKNALENSYDKHPEPLEIEQTKHQIPIEIFGDKTLSLQEHICHYLKQEGLRNKEIAELIGKDQRTVWTVLDRAKDKLGGEQE